MSGKSNSKSPVKSGAAATPAAKVTSSKKNGGGGLTVWRGALLALVVVLAAVALQQWSRSSGVAAPTATRTPPRVKSDEPAVTVQSETFSVGATEDAEDDSVEHVHINLKAQPEPERGGIELEVVERDSTQASDVDAYVQHVQSVWSSYSDDAPAQAKLSLSTDADTARLESVALLLQDHAGLVEFMMFPANPEHLRESPSLNALAPAARHEARKRVTDEWRSRAKDYVYLQRAVVAFRDQLWALIGDFEDVAKLKPKQFLALSPMERQIIAKTVAPDAQIYSQISFSIRSHLFWEFLADQLHTHQI
jgi:hypothetical protein